MIPVLRPTYTEKIKKDLCDVLDSGWTGFGSKTIEFEKKFAEKVGSKYAVATNSGTSALDLCLKVYGIKGGELITTPLTFVSDAIVGLWQNMDVTFADIEEDSLCLDPKSIVVTEDTKAIIVVDSHGRLADIDAIRHRANQDIAGIGYSCPLIIEDAAHAMYTLNSNDKLIRDMARKRQTDHNILDRICLTRSVFHFDCCDFLL